MTRDFYPIIEVVVVLVELPGIVQCRCGQFEALRAGKLVGTNQLIDVFILNHEGEPQIGAPRLLQHAQPLHLGRMAVLFTPNTVIGGFIAFQAEAHFDVRIFLDDRDQFLRMQAVGTDLHDACLGVQYVDQRRKIAPQGGLAAREIEVVEAPRKLRKSLRRHFQFRLGGILPDVAHLAARVAAERGNNGQIH